MANKCSKLFDNIVNKTKRFITSELVFCLIGMREITKEEFKMITEIQRKG